MHLSTSACLVDVLYKYMNAQSNLNFPLGQRSIVNLQLVLLLLVPMSFYIKF